MGCQHQRKRILLRFAAAFAVLLAHYNHFFIHGYAYRGYAYEKQPLFAAFAPFYHYGTRAVEVFWCLSGFVFFYRYDTLNDRRLSFRQFFWLRFSRLYPLHLLTLLLVAGLQWTYYRLNGTYFVVEINNAKHFLLNLFFASYWGFQDGFSFNAPVWSVSLEILAYGFFFGVSYWLGSGLFLTSVCLVMCVAANHYTGTEPILVRCIFFFYLGGLSCGIFRASRRRLGPGKEYLTLLPMTALLVVAAAAFQRSANLEWILQLGVPSALIILATASRLFPKALAHGAMALGNLTYASYLIHFPLQILAMIICGVAHVPEGSAYSPLFLFGYLAVVFGLSHAIYSRIEMPAQELIRARMLPRLAV